MKKLFITILAACLMCSLAAFAQDTTGKDNMGKDSMSKDTMAPAPLKTLKGTVQADGDKLTFVNDADQKAWDVMNPEKLKGHEGHHVQLSAHVYADKNSIHVMSVKMLKAAKPAM
jgi:pentapeptide MXKDX repeat protein